MIKAVLFDFDGVIIDSYSNTIETFQSTLAHFNRRVPKKEEFDNFLGLTAIDMLKHFLGTASEEELNKIDNYKTEIAIKTIPEIKLISGAKNVIKKLANQHKLAIVSSRRQYGLNILVDQYKLRPYFTTIITAEDVKNHKPHPEPLLKTLKALGVKNTEAVYIGDTESDVGAAKNAKMPCILISKSKDSLDANYHIKTIKELPALINIINEK